MSKECPFQKGGFAFDQEETSDCDVCSAEGKLNSVWQKVIENRVYSSGSEWPTMSSFMSEDYSSIYENKIDVQEVKTKVKQFHEICTSYLFLLNFSNS
jgi:hypothetical protein